LAVLSVGSGQQFQTIAAAVAASRDGDVLAVQAGTYVNDFATITTKITIQGVGGMAKLVATVPPPNGKAILVTRNDVTIDNLEFSGAKVADRNGAGIRHEAGRLTVTDSSFHHNENGILAGSIAGASIAIERSEFAFNGRGDGYTHGLYVGVIDSLTVRNSYFHDTAEGHHIKSRALATTVTGSRLFDLNGTTSYDIDLPNGGKAVVTGNVIQQGANTHNFAMVHFGGEAAPHAGSALTIGNNLVDNDYASSGARLLWNQTTITAAVTNNSVQGLTAAQIATGPASVSGTVFQTAEPSLDTTSPIGAAAPAPTAPAPAPSPAPAPAPEAGVFRNGTAGADSLAGGGGPDTLIGNEGADTLAGAGGNDTLAGGADADRLTGGAGNDVLIGGFGADSFAFGAGFGRDVIMDFDADPAGGQDRLDLTALNVSAASFAATVRVAQSGYDTVVTIGADSVTLMNVGAASVTRDDFTLIG
jgi:Ca2+-binding RTX toxin-like protein